jgi:hypothetical protein
MGIRPQHDDFVICAIYESDLGHMFNSDHDSRKCDLL